MLNIQMVVMIIFFMASTLFSTELQQYNSISLKIVQVYLKLNVSSVSISKQNLTWAVF